MLVSYWLSKIVFLLVPQIYNDISICYVKRQAPSAKRQAPNTIIYGARADILGRTTEYKDIDNGKSSIGAMVLINRKNNLKNF